MLEVERENDLILRVEGEGGSVWWRNLINISQDFGVGVGRWIDDNIVCEVGEGASILFWCDP